MQNFFLHASLPVLKYFFPDDYFCHFALLVITIWLLTSDIITESDIEIAKLLIQSYQRLIPSLYGEKEETYTCHALGHLPDRMRDHGLLILHSSFVFEAMISHLKRQFHGTRGIVAQIVRNLLLAQNSGSFIKEKTQEPQEVKMFIEENIVRKKRQGASHTRSMPFLASSLDEQSRTSRGSDALFGSGGSASSPGRKDAKRWSNFSQFGV